MAAYNKFNSFVEALSEKIHNLGADTLTVAMCAAANAPVAANTKLGDLTQISYTYCSARAITITSSAQTGGTYKLVLQDLTLTASGGAVGPFRYVVIYNDSDATTPDALICWFDYGQDITLNDGESLQLDFDGTNGVLQLA